MVTFMPRYVRFFFLLLLITLPLAAQTEKRLGVRAGVAQFEAEGFRTRFNTTALVLGADFWMRRGRFALDVGFDGYQVKGTDTFKIVSADVQFLIGRLAIGAGPSLIGSEDSDITFVPSISLNLPAGRRQFVAMVRHFEGDIGFEDSTTTMFLLGLRSAPWGR